MKNLLIMSALVMAFNAFGLTCKLKTSVTVDVLDDAGNAVETKRLKAGTKIEVEEDSDEKNKASANRLKPSGITIQNFKSTKPSKGAVFRAKIEIATHNGYDGYFEGKEKSIMCYEITVCGEDGGYVGSFSGYVQKMSKLGKELRLKVKDGAERMVYVKLRPIKQAHFDDAVYIDDIEFL